MALRIELGKSRREPKAEGCVPHKRKILVAHQSGPVPAMVLQKFAEGENAVLPQEKTKIAMSASGAAGMAVTASLIGLLYDAQIEAARRLAGPGIVSHRRFAGEIGADDPRRCRRGVVAMTFFIDVLGRRQLLHFVNRGLTKKPHILAGDGYSANEDLLSAGFLNDAHF
jgi:hypothetical protein